MNRDRRIVDRKGGASGPTGVISKEALGRGALIMPRTYANAHPTRPSIFGSPGVYDSTGESAFRMRDSRSEAYAELFASRAREGLRHIQQDRVNPGARNRQLAAVQTGGPMAVSRYDQTKIASLKQNPTKTTSYATEQARTPAPQVTGVLRAPLNLKGLGNKGQNRATYNWSRTGEVRAGGPLRA